MARTTFRAGLGIVAGAVAIPLLLLCLAPRAPADEPPGRPSLVSADWPMDRAAERGRTVYERWCIGCHGPEGEGDGEAAALLSPIPRNFQRGHFKFRSTPSGAPPLRDDLFRTITCGLPGSSMPGFPLVSEAERRDVVEYLLHLMSLGRGKSEVSYLMEEEGLSLDVIRRDHLAEIRADVERTMAAEAVPVPVPPEPEATPESVARGGELFALQCAACHGETGIGDGFSSYTLRDWKDSEIRPRDFTTGVFRAGSTGRDVYLRLKTGLNGTPMPAIPGSDEDLWALVHFIKSLVAKDAREPKHQHPGCGGTEVKR